MRLFVLGACLLLLTGCGHQLTFKGRNGAVGTGTATSGIGQGTVKASLNGQRYTGHWVAADPGMMGGSTGTALLTSDAGGHLRCSFLYGGMTGAGYGTCHDEADQTYDMQIH